jgi:hypothetical protein
MRQYRSLIPIMIRKLTGLLLLLASSLALAVPAAYVHEMTGSGSATTKGQARPLEVGGLLESGDVISVAKGGTMTVKFEDGQIVVLQENSRFAIEKYEYNKQKVAESSAVMSLLSGGMRFITGVIGGTRKDAIAMKAGTATIGIRGTDCGDHHCRRHVCRHCAEWRNCTQPAQSADRCD